MNRSSIIRFLLTNKNYIIIIIQYIYIYQYIYKKEREFTNRLNRFRKELNEVTKYITEYITETKKNTILTIN